MLDWPDIQDWLSRRWPVLKKRPTAMLLVPAFDGRGPKISIEWLPDESQPAVAVVAALFASRHLAAEEALRYNAVAEHGALALRQGMLVLRQLLPLDGLTGERLDGAIRAAAIETTRWVRHVNRPPPTRLRCEMFAHMCD